MRKSDQGSVRLAPVWDSKVSHYRLACFAQRRWALWACLGEMCRCCILLAGVAVYKWGVRGHDGVVWAFSGDDQFRWCCRGAGLQAHNYWDNKEQFITQLAELLKSAAA
jgi:hypothetical protein